MDAEPTPHASSSTSGAGRFASPGLLRFLAWIVLLVGLAAPVAGVVYLINGATQAGAFVEVQVDVTDMGALQVPLMTDAGGESRLPLRQAPGDDPGSIRLVVPTPAGDGWLEAPVDQLRLHAWDSTVAEQLLSRGAVAVLGLCVGLGAWLLRRLLLSIANGQPFQRGNPARIAGIAVLVVVGSLASEVLPAVAGGLVLDRLGLGGVGSPVSSLPVDLSLEPFAAALALLAVAEAFRGGGELVRDLEGLV